MENHEKFNLEDDFTVHEEMLSQLFLIKDVKDDEKKRAHLITSLSFNAFKLLRSMCSPKTPIDMSYVELVKILKEQFVRKTVTYKERRRFYEATQNSGETIREYYNKIKSLAVNCDFGAELSNVLRDKFICGVKLGPVFDRLCDEKSDLTLDKCLEIAFAREGAESEKMCHAIHRKSNNAKENHESNGKSKYSSSQASTGSNSGMKCNACGRDNHDFKRCKYRKYTCRKCHKRGHLEVACVLAPAGHKTSENRRKPSQHTSSGQDKRNHHLEEAVETEAESLSLFTMEVDVEQPKIGKFNFFDNCDRSCLNVFTNFRSFKVNSDSWTAVMDVDGIPITFEIDTGSAISAMPEKLYREKFSHHNLRMFSSTLKAYDGSLIPNKGTFDVKVFNKDASFTASFVIIESNSRPLLGRDLLAWLGFEIKMHNIGESKYQSVDTLVSEFKGLFSEKLGEYNVSKIALELKDDSSQSIFVKPRKVPFAYREALEQELVRLEGMNIIEKVDTVSWGTPLVTVMKSNGKIRLCADYSVTINPLLKEQNYPLPKIDDIFQSLQGGQLFSKIDLSEAYYQLPVDEKTSKLLAWSTHKGVFKVKRLPFGCKPNSSIFQSVMERVLAGCKSTVVFIDDIVVAGVNDVDHLQNLKSVFSKLRDVGFTVNKNKCKFFQPKVHFLGYIIDAEGLHKDPKKVDAISNMPNPESKTQIKAFCGLINYYGRFVNNLSAVLKPLYDLSTQTVFIWNDLCQNAVTKVKELIVSDVVLVHYDPKRKLELCTDASTYGIGACLSHLFDFESRPVAFCSRTLSKAEQNYSMIDKEALAIFYGVKKFEQYLIGRKFCIKTDHQPLVSIFGSKKGIPMMAASRLQRWSLYLSQFDFEISFLKGSDNGCADALSRLTKNCDEDTENEFSYLNFVTNRFEKPLKCDDIAKQSVLESILGQVILFVKNGWPEMKQVEGELKSFYEKRREISLEQGVLMWGHRVIIPKEFRSDLLKEIHSSHMGIVKSKSLVRSYFWWPNIDNDLENWIKSCTICRENQNNPPKISSVKWPEANAPLERIHIDFCHPVNSNYLVIIDVFSKWVEVVKCKTISTQEVIRELRKFFASFGMPKKIVSDNGGCFSSVEFNQFCSVNGIDHMTSPPYHPPSNGQAENSVKNFKNYFKKVLDETKKGEDIDKVVQKILYFTRNSVHSETKKTPFELMFGRKPYLRWDMILPKVGEKKNETENDEAFKVAKNLILGQEVYIKCFDSGKWKFGKIVKISGRSVFEVELENGKTVRRHANHITPYEKRQNAQIEDKSQTSMLKQSRSLSDILKETIKESENGISENPMVHLDGGANTSRVVMAGSDSVTRNVSNPQPITAARSSERPKRTIKAPSKLNL